MDRTPRDISDLFCDGLDRRSLPNPIAFSIALHRARSILGSTMDGRSLASYPLLFVGSGSDVRSSGHLGWRSSSVAHSTYERISQGDTGILRNA